MTAVCLLPQFFIVQFNVTFQLGGTALLIVVVVVMDFMAQVQTHLMSNQYESLMKVQLAKLWTTVSVNNESKSFSKENVSKLPNHSASRFSTCDLF